MKYYHGIAVAPGVAIGLLSVVANNQLFIPRRAIDANQVDDELRRLEAAFERAQTAVSQCRDKAQEELGGQYAQIFEAHLLFLMDPNLRARVETAIQDDLVSVEFAVAQAFDFYAAQLRKLQDATYAERANDINDVKNIVLRELLAVKQGSVVDERYPVIVAASFLAPSEAAKLEPAMTLGIVTEQGGRGSHTSIVASALGVPIYRAPFAFSSPEWGNEKGIDAALGFRLLGVSSYHCVEAPIHGSKNVIEFLKDGTRELLGSTMNVEVDPIKLGERIVADMKLKRAALGWN